MKYAKTRNGKILNLSAEDIILTDEEVNSGIVVVQVSDEAQLEGDVSDYPATESPPPPETGAST